MSSLGPHSMTIDQLIDGLRLPTPAQLARPHDIIPVEDEHEYEVILYPPTPAAAPGQVDEVGEREQQGGEAPLVRLQRELQDFQEIERARFGLVAFPDVLAGQDHMLEGLEAESICDSDEDENMDQDSEKESMQDSDEDENMNQGSRPAGEPNYPRTPKSDVPMQVERVPTQSERHSGAAEKPIPRTLEGFIQAEGLTAQVQYNYSNCAGLSTAELNAGAPAEDQSHTIQADQLMAKYQSELRPPLEESHTHELIKACNNPFQSATVSDLSLTLDTRVAIANIGVTGYIRSLHHEIMQE